MKYLILNFCLLLLFSANISAMELKAKQISLDLTISQPSVKLSNGLLHLTIPVEKLINAIILTSNNDPVVILDREKQISFSVNTAGKDLLLEGFKNNQSMISNKIADIPGIIFGLQEQVINTSADKEFAKVISNITEVMLSPDEHSHAYYLTKKNKTVFFLINKPQNFAFIVSKNQKDYFTTIISNNINKEEFINLIVKGALQ